MCSNERDHSDFQASVTLFQLYTIHILVNILTCLTFLSFPPIHISTQLVISYWIIFILSLPPSLSPSVCYFKITFKWVKYACCTKLRRFKGRAVKSKSCPHTCLPATFALLRNSKVANCFSFSFLRWVFYLFI